MLRRGRGDIGEGMLAVLLLAPAAALLALIVLFPVLRLVWLSLHTVRLSEPWLGEPFAGLLNYQDVWADPRFWDSLANTLLITVITVPGALLVGLGLALL